MPPCAWISERQANQRWPGDYRNRTKVKVVKNKIAPPFKYAEFDIIYGEGISREGDILDLGVAHDIVEKSGTWYSFGGNRIGQGRDNARTYLKDHPEALSEIETRVKQTYGLIKEAGQKADS